MCSQAVLELEELAEPYAGKVLVPVAGQALSGGGVALQVSVEVLVEDLRGRTVGVVGPAKVTVHQVKSKKAATKARKMA